MPKNEQKPTKCSNCGYEFKDADNYCPECGQKNHDIKIPFKRLMVEVAENTLDLDSKAFRTVKYLLFKPGYLSFEFNSGKRVRYVPPIRLYLLISFIFFFLLNVFSLSGPSVHTDGNSQTVKGKSKTHISFKNFSTDELAGMTKAQVDSLMIARNLEQTKFNRWAVYQIHRVANIGMGQFSQLFMKNVSYMMFVLMPVLGVLIYWFNRKRIDYYIESLVISIHFHSFVFLFFSITLLTVHIVKQPYIYLLWLIVPPVYIVLMFLNYFKQGFWITAVKSFFIGLLYNVFLILLIISTLVVSIILI